jgi:hypothetical protein
MAIHFRGIGSRLRICGQPTKRFRQDHNGEATRFTWTAYPDKISPLSNVGAERQIQSKRFYTRH